MLGPFEETCQLDLLAHLVLVVSRNRPRPHQVACADPAVRRRVLRELQERRPGEASRIARADLVSSAVPLEVGGQFDVEGSVSRNPRSGSARTAESCALGASSTFNVVS